MLDAAEKVCAIGDDEDRALLDRLTSLVDKSLVQSDERNGVTRYQLLETMREYGWERLREHDEETVSPDRHLHYFVGLAEEAEPHLDSSAPEARLDRLEAEHDNLRAAMAWATRGGHPSQGMRLAAGIWRFWWLRGYISEGRALLTPLLGPSAAHVDPAPGTAPGAAECWSPPSGSPRGGPISARGSPGDPPAARRSVQDRRRAQCPGNDARSSGRTHSSARGPGGGFGLLPRAG